MMQPPWTAEETQTALKGWYEGLSASQIARQIKRTRNAVIGKLHRIGAPKRAAAHITPRPNNPYGRRGHPRRALEAFKAPKLKPMPVKALHADLSAIAALFPVDPTLDVLRLNTLTCRYPIGDPKEAGFTFCGRTCGGVYCRDHLRLAYEPNRARRAPRQQQSRARELRLLEGGW